MSIIHYSGIVISKISELTLIKESFLDIDQSGAIQLTLDLEES